MEDWLWLAGLAVVWLLGDMIRGHDIRRGLDNLAAAIDRHREAMEFEDEEDEDEPWKRGAHD